MLIAQAALFVILAVVVLLVVAALVVLSLIGRLFTPWFQAVMYPKRISLALMDVAEPGTKAPKGRHTCSSGQDVRLTEVSYASIR